MTRRRMRWMIGLVVVGFWLVMTGLLVHRELGGRLLPEAPRLPLTEARESWMGIFLEKGQRVGWVHLRQEPEKRQGQDGSTMTLRARMTLNLLGRTTDLDLFGSVWRPHAEPRADFEFGVRAADHHFRVAGRVAGGQLRGEVLSGGEKIPLTLPVSDEVLFAGGFGTALQFPLLEVGDEFRLDAFDPLTLQKSPVRVRCLARESLPVAGEVVATRVLVVDAQGIRSRAWIDERGEVVQAATPFGFVIRKIRPEEAEGASGAALGDLLALAAIRPRGRRPFREARRMEVRISGLEGRTLPEDELQVALGDGRYRLRTPSAPAAGIAVGTGPELQPHLTADAFVQSDHPRIRHQAAAIVGDESDPWRRARRLNDWLYANLEKEPVLSIPSALEVLNRRRGDCNEHTVLYAALARAAGIPTRIAIGVVWSDELDGFYYHAWPEVHLGGWVGLDPTLGQAVADATHLKLLTGGIESWPQLLPFLGQLEIEVLEVQ